MKLTNKEISSYLVWVALNLFVLLGLGSADRLQNGNFYPFSGGFEEVRDYDISEFLIYTIVPLLIILALKLNKKIQE